MAFSSHNSSYTSGLAPLNILRAVRLSNKLLWQGYVRGHLTSSLRKFYGRYGDLTKQYEVPLFRMLHDILDDDHIQLHPELIRHCTLHFWTVTDLDLIAEFELLPNYARFPYRTFKRVRHANRGRKLLRTPGPVPFWDLYVL